jgi:hypothetical protein
MSTTAVNIKYEPYDLYIGRTNRRYKLEGNLYSNPYVIGKDGKRHEVLRKYAAWLLAQDTAQTRAIVEGIGYMRESRLGCWCKPERCHGDILAALADLDTIEERLAWLQEYIQKWDALWRIRLTAIEQNMR